MDILPGSIGVVGTQKEIETFDLLKDFLKKYEGLLGFKIPSIGIKDKNDIPSFIGIIENHCIFIIDVVEKRLTQVDETGEFWEFSDDSNQISRDIILDNFHKEVENRLKNDIKLFNRRKGELNIPIIKLLVFGNNLESDLTTYYENGTIINEFNSIDTLIRSLQERIDESNFNTELNSNIYSLLEGTTAFEKKDKVVQPSELIQLSDFINRSLITTFKLDQEQRKVAMQLPQGPQRIRGLAGTGKTVILALKAALTHKDIDDFKILFVFNTQSMYNQIRGLVSKYYTYETRTEPNWDKLEILHAWGGSSKEGFYSKTCKMLGVAPFSFLQVRKFGDPYEYIFNDLLNKLKTIKIEPIYDMVLIDEAQDFPQPFFELIYLLTKPPKRIVWAYDEFQSLNELRIKEPEELFGKNIDGKPNIPNEELSGEYIGGIDKDFILPNSYRNPRIALQTAHGLGLGIYREEGIIDILPDKRSWKAIGYEVIAPNKDVFAEGDNMDIERPDRNNKNILEALLKENGRDEKSLFKLLKFNSKSEEYKYLATEISRLINNEKFKPEQIIVISLAASKTKDIFAFIRQLLDSLKIKCITPGFVESSDMFMENGFVTLTTPYRAKGNEADVVFVIDSESIITNYSFRARNAAFVSITRTRGCCYIIGSGKRMESLEEEYNSLIENYPHFKFTFPAEEDLKRRRVVINKNSDEIERSGQQLDRIIEENPELLIEILKSRPDLLEKLNKGK